LYDIRPGNGAGLFLQPWSGPHGANIVAIFLVSGSERFPTLLSVATTPAKVMERCQRRTANALVDVHTSYLHPYKGTAKQQKVTKQRRARVAGLYWTGPHFQHGAVLM